MSFLSLSLCFFLSLSVSFLSVAKAKGDIFISPDRSFSSTKRPRLRRWLSSTMGNGVLSICCSSTNENGSLSLFLSSPRRKALHLSDRWLSSTKRPRLCLRLSTRKGNVISIGGSPLHTKTAINLSVSFLSSAKRQALSLFLLRRIERWIVKEA